MSEQKHSQEPWRVDSDSDYILCGPDDENPNGYVIAEVGWTDDLGEDAANQARIVSCVNALAGVEDPEAAVKQAREALADAMPLLSRYGHLHDYRKCESALAALTPKQEQKP